MVTLSEAYARLAGLSEERARKVFSLIEDLADLEALENAEDLIAVKKVLANPESVPWESLKAELDVLHHSG